MAALPGRRLGSSDVEVSALGLGSWRTYERIPREEGVALMTAAREAGITFLDDARYNDETGTAPIASGYSEVVFGELFRAAGWKRDEVVVSNKLWWEFWPEQSAADELESSLGRMGFSYVDLVYAEHPPDGLPVAEVVEAVAALVVAGTARAWGVLNWPPELLAEAAQIAAQLGAPGPCAAQLPYSLAQREVVEDAAMASALEAADVGVVASFVLAGGALTSKYEKPDAAGRLAANRHRPEWRDAFEVGRKLEALAAEMGTSPSRLAISFALANPQIASVLFGATRPEQIADNVSAVALLASMSAPELAELRSIGA